MACTETAPAGSSTSNFSSNHSTEKVTKAPAIEPITMASAGTMKAHVALLATRPPIQPLALSDASGLPKRIAVMTAAVRHAAAACSNVLIAIKTDCPGAPPVKRIAPAEFSPNQPSSASTHPNKTRTPLWPGIAGAMPSGEYFPRRGPKIQVTASAVSPPTT